MSTEALGERDRSFTTRPLPRILSDCHVQRLVKVACTDLGETEVLRRSASRAIVRVSLPEVGPVIIKAWALRGVRMALRRITLTSPPLREARALQRLHRAGVRVPRYLGSCRIRLNSVPYTHALILEDIGECKDAVEHLKGLVLEREEADVWAFEEALIEQTHRILGAGYVDLDHGLINTVVPVSGEPVRLDLECAKRVSFPIVASRTCGTMLGRLICSHAFAVQPEVERTQDFACRLVQRLRLRTAVLRRAAECVRSMLAEQLAKTGIDTRVRLPW